MLKKILIAIVVVIVVLLGAAYILPRTVHVERSIIIDAPRATVFTLVNSFKRFNQWSPWSAVDPGAKYSYSGPDSGVGAVMSWVGDPKKVGSGNQAITESRPYELVRVTIDFGPQGKATGTHTLAREGKGTRVKWGFDTDVGMNPIARYFGLRFDRMIGPDYEKGLAGLKKLAEGLSKTDFEGLSVQVVDVAPVNIAFADAVCGQDAGDIAQQIGAGFLEVNRFLRAQRLTAAGAPIVINAKQDDTGYVFETALPVDRLPERAVPAASKVKIKQTYAGRALKVVHKGSYGEMVTTYDKLAAFVSAAGYVAAGPTWEEYVTDPAKTAEADLVTHIYQPVR